MATIAASENVFPVLRMSEVAAPSTPPTGEAHLYVKSDGLLYWKDDAGTEYPVSQAADLAAHLADTSDAHDASAISFTPTGTIAATDVQAAIAEAAAEAAAGGIAVSLADNAGDMVVASAADTWAKLATPTVNGQSLRRVSGSVAWELPPGYEFDYAQFTSNVTINQSAFASAVTVITGNAVTYDGSTIVRIEFFAPIAQADNVANRDLACYLFDGATSLGIIAYLRSESTNRGVNSLYGVRRLTPSAASHTYSIKATETGADGSIQAGAGGSTSADILPGFIRITKV